MLATAASDQAPKVEQPKHPLHALTTYELSAYLRQPEAAVAFFEQTEAPVLALMRDRLAQARAEHDERMRIRRAASR